ncbi:MAG: hypothetical protein RL164_542 [Bacteroidota bacterium]|jgi:hypothetical protein
MKNILVLFTYIFLLKSILLSQQSLIDNSIKYLNKNNSSPQDYIIDKFSIADVILLAEDHRVKENLQFLGSLIPQLYKNGIFTIGMEFGAYEDQRLLDSLVTAETYDENLARQLMFNYNPGWAFKEYMDIYRCAWTYNQTLTKNERKFRILNLSYKYNWTAFSGQRTPENMKSVFYNGNIEFFRFKILENEIIRKKEKVLILTGDVHAFTKYHFPFYDFASPNYVRFDSTYFGNLIHAKYPKKVFSILLHKPFYNYPNKKPLLISPANGKIEQIMSLLSNQPMGFDLMNTPLGDLPDSSYYSMGYPNFKLSDLYDGYIFLKPIKQLSSCTIDTLFLNEANLQEAFKNIPDPDWHPKPNSLAAYWEQIYNFADVVKYYEKTDVE